MHAIRRRRRAPRAAARAQHTWMRRAATVVRPVPLLASIVSAAAAVCLCAPLRPAKVDESRARNEPPFLAVLRGLAALLDTNARVKLSLDFQSTSCAESRHRLACTSRTSRKEREMRSFLYCARCARERRFQGLGCELLGWVKPVRSLSPCWQASGHRPSREHERRRPAGGGCRAREGRTEQLCNAFERFGRRASQCLCCSCVCVVCVCVLFVSFRHAKPRRRSAAAPPQPQTFRPRGSRGHATRLQKHKAWQSGAAAGVRT